MLLGLILIFALQLVYVPIMTLRTIFLVKNMSVAASAFGVLEALSYVFGLSLVFSGHKSILQMVIYALGYGTGFFIGSKIEKRLAIGYTSLVVNLMDINEELISVLRCQGFGVTVFEGMGRDSKRYQLEILTKRNREEEVFALIEEYEPKAFIISYEPRKFKGGFLVKAMKNRMKKLKQKELENQQHA